MAEIALTVGRLRDLMTVASRARYLAWRGMPIPSEIVVSLVSGTRLIVRPPPAHDLSVAHEIFVQQIYRPRLGKAPAEVRLIVDVGSNVGYSVVYFARMFPNARIVGFEPNPENLRLVEKNLKLNNLQDRVEIRDFAVGVSQGIGYLVDQGAATYVSAEGSSRGKQIRVVDFFSQLDCERIDILKIDCEGAEHPIIMDDRFAEISPTECLMVEWHATSEHPDAKHDILQKLVATGWKVEQAGERDGTDIRDGLLAFGQFNAYR